MHRNIIDCGLADDIQLVISDSVAAAELFADESFAWVHIDARHDYDSVVADIDAWAPKVKPGGWLSGDDYQADWWPGVVPAVHDTLPDAGRGDRCSGGGSSRIEWVVRQRDFLGGDAAKCSACQAHTGAYRWTGENPGAGSGNRSTTVVGSPALYITD